MESINLSLVGLIPSKKNSRISTKSGRSFPSKKYTAWHKDAMNQLRGQIGLEEPLEKINSIELKLVFGSKHKSDLTNKAESVMDLLVDFGVLKDDNWFVVPKVILSGSYIKNEPGVLIILETIPEPL